MAFSSLKINIFKYYQTINVKFTLFNTVNAVKCSHNEMQKIFQYGAQLNLQKGQILNPVIT